MTKSSVLFLCIGNSCRSQMAEAIVNARWGDTWQAYSAGSHPTGFVHPFAIQVLREVGIEHSGHSKPIEEVRSIPFDMIITVCDSAAEECSIWLGNGQSLHLNFPDPAKVSASEAQIMGAFRRVRDDIAREIIPLLIPG